MKVPQWLAPAIMVLVLTFLGGIPGIIISAIVVAIYFGIWKPKGD